MTGSPVPPHGRSFGDLNRPPLSARALTSALVQPGGLWSRIDVLASVASTNAVVADAARAGAAEGLVVIAEAQTAGRGRLDRSWVSPPRAGVTMSVLLRPQVQEVAEWSWLPLLSGLAVLQALSGHCGVADAALKWPNDVLASRPAGKLAGLLAEVPAAGCVVVGIGLNVSTTAAELPAGGVSLTTLGATVTDRDTVIKAVLRSLAARYDRWHLAPEEVRAAYRARCSTLGREVELHLPGAVVTRGRASDVDDAGRLVVDGTAYAAGDVVHVR